MVQRLVDGVFHFQTQIFPRQRERFERLARGQSPQAVFVTCSDSRIDPNLITNSKPGDLFVVRNPGNLVPPYAMPSDAGAAMEFALQTLGVRDVIICGHTCCGAVAGLLDLDQLANLPTLARWLTHAEPVRARLNQWSSMDPNSRLNAAIELNVLVQLEHLGTHPFVATRLARGEVALHAWVYHLETGEVRAYDPARGTFRPLVENHFLSGTALPAILPGCRLTDATQGDD